MCNIIYLIFIECAISFETELDFLEIFYHSSTLLTISSKLHDFFVHIILFIINVVFHSVEYLERWILI